MTITEAAENILQGFYARKVSTGGITEEIISFEDEGGDNKWMFFCDDEKLQKALLESTEDSSVAVKNALQFLKEEGLINFKYNGLLSGNFDLYNLDITSKGVKTIEGVTSPSSARTYYENTFNVKLNLAENINIESFLKTELGLSLFKLFSVN